MKIETIAVVGAGTMGAGIAQAAAQGGYRVILGDLKEEYVEAGIARMKERLEKRVGEGKLESRERDGILLRIATASDPEDFGKVDLIIEAVTEREEIKKQVFQELDKICQEETVFASNSSSIPIRRLAQAVRRPGRFAGMHFMNPAYVMKLVEVIRGPGTSEETLGIIKAAAEKMGKIPVIVNDSPGFVANRLIMPMINDAIFCLQEGIALREGIDTIMKIGVNHPMGPLELADFIGLDICLDILEVLHADLGEKYRPCPLLREMVAGGKLGKKEGEGFYEYR